jgi:DNA-binding MarR family transcriptional regulator/ribosomal protein S18 acetylase RimI-like enzyme
MDTSRQASSAPVEAVRRFHRFYTREIGVLHEHLLKSPLSLTEVRVLYELAHRDAITARELCDGLGLDAGYVSRMLRGFERRRWLTTSESPTDRRRRHLSLTAAGRRAFAPLDRRASAEVESMLAKLSSGKCQTVLGAMRQIQDILGEAPAEATPHILRSHRDIGWVVQRHGAVYAQEFGYDERFEALVARVVADFVQHFDPARERCWIAERGGENVGSIFLVKQSKRIAKLRLLLVEPGARGLGLGQRLVTECIAFARAAGYRRIVLWTQSELAAARRLYEAAGFTLESSTPHRSWGRDDLVGETWRLTL